MTDKLLDITNLIIPEENVRFLNEEETIELYQTCLYLMDWVQKAFHWHRIL